MRDLADTFWIGLIASVLTPPPEKPPPKPSLATAVGDPPEPHGKIPGELAALIILIISVCFAVAAPPAQIVGRCIALGVCLVFGLVLAVWADIPRMRVPAWARVVAASFWVFGIGLEARAIVLSAQPPEPPVAFAVYGPFQSLYAQVRGKLGNPIASAVMPDREGQAFHERAMILTLQFNAVPSDRERGLRVIPGTVIVGKAAQWWEQRPNQTDRDFEYYNTAKRIYRDAGLIPPKGFAVPLQGVGSLLYHDRPLLRKVGFLGVARSGQLKHCEVSGNERARAQRFERGWIIGPVYPRINTPERLIYVLPDHSEFQEVTAQLAAEGCRTDRSVNDVPKVGPTNDF